MRGDKRIPEKEITVLSELLMVQLLKLDSIEADGEAKAQRRIEVYLSNTSHLITMHFLLFPFYI